MRPSKRVAVARLAAANKDNSASLSEDVTGSSSDLEWNGSAAEADSFRAGCKKRARQATLETTGTGETPPKYDAALQFSECQGTSRYGSERMMSSLTPPSNTAHWQAQVSLGTDMLLQVTYLLH